MARVYGVAGEWARVKGMVTGLWPLFLGVFMAGFAVAATAFADVVWGLALLVASIIYSCWSLLKGLRHAERFFKGARGEERVSGILTHLPDTYHVFNDFVAGGKHVDHVVAGPAGVFAVETKYSSTGGFPTATPSSRRRRRHSSSRRRWPPPAGTAR